MSPPRRGWALQYASDLSGLVLRALLSSLHFRMQGWFASPPAVWQSVLLPDSLIVHELKLLVIGSGFTVRIPCLPCLARDPAYSDYSVFVGPCVAHLILAFLLDCLDYSFLS